MLKYQSAVIFVRDIERSKAFYMDVLGQEIEVDFGANVGFKSGFAIWQIWSEHIIARQRRIAIPAGENINSFELYFEADDFDAACKRLQAADVNFLHLPHEEPWGQRTTRFFDPDGHLVEVGEPMATFIRRLHDEGRTPEQVAEKSGVPLEGVQEFLKVGQGA